MNNLPFDSFVGTGPRILQTSQPSIDRGTNDGDPLSLIWDYGVGDDYRW